MVEIRCGKCGKLLVKLSDSPKGLEVEGKCPRCKQFNKVVFMK